MFSELLKKKNIVYLSITFLFFFGTHLLMLLINGEWWDDYVAWNVPLENLYKEYGPENCNDIFNLYYLSFIYQHIAPQYHILVFRLTSFIVLWIFVVCSWIVVNHLTNNKHFSFLVCLLIATFGFDRTAFLTVCIHYAVANTLFMLGLILFIKDYQKEKFSFLIGTAVIWFTSLIVWRSAALLIPASVIIASGLKTNFNYRVVSSYVNIGKYTIKRYWTIILSCILFVLIYKIFLDQSGIHASYYKPSIVNALMAPILALISCFTTIISYPALCLQSLTLEYSLPVALISIALVVAVCLNVKRIPHLPILDTLRKKLIMHSFVFLLLSFILPLSIYGIFTLATPIEYRSRTWSLAALPLAVVYVSLLNYLPRKFFCILYALLLSGSILYTVSGYIDYGFSLSKTEAIVHFLKEHKELENEKILFIDNSIDANGQGFNLRNYEYEGMARIAYGINTNTLAMSYYGGNRQKFDPSYKVFISQSRYPVQFSDKAKYVAYKHIFHNEAKAEKVLGNLYQIELK